MRTRLFYAMFVVLALSSSAIAQNFPRPTKPFYPTLQQLTAPNPETYGTASEVVIAIPDWEFNPFQSGTTFAWSPLGRYVDSAGFGLLEAGVHFPEGASVTRVEVQACNVNPTPGAGAHVFLGEISNSSGASSSIAQVFITANSGCTLFPVTVSPAYTVNNATNSYHLEWYNGGAIDGTITLQAVRVFYQLQVSHPPVAPTFGDVPTTHPFFKFVEALYASGITAGCGNGNYCPDAPVTRGQMAVFLSAALGLHWAP